LWFLPYKKAVNAALIMLMPDTLLTLAGFDCIVLRGLPGSGKSTIAQRLVELHGRVHLEADQHFVANGVYRFDPARAADAHAVVARDTLAALQAGRRVVVANTHVRLWEMAAVVGAARLAGRTICFLECRGAWPNVHGLAESVIVSMRQRWERLPSEFDAVSFIAQELDAVTGRGCGVTKWST
jgi:AAA domain